MNLVLCAMEPPLADAWETFCGDLPFVSVYRGSIFDVECDAVVSPANSFGFMDGGIDLLYSRFFGWEIETRVQNAIKTRYSSELLVGAADIVETGHADIPYLIAAPTMRVPMVLTDTVNPFLAARAVLLLVQNGIFADDANAGKPIAEVVKTVAFPGLGTGVGKVGSNTCAFQMREAIEAVVNGNVAFPATWSEAQNRHLALQSLPPRDLQRPETGA